MNTVEKIKPLTRQSPSSANARLSDAIENIDSILGSGYAAANPQVLAAYLNAAGADNAALVRSLNEINETLQKLYRRYDDIADRY